MHEFQGETGTLSLARMRLFQEYGKFFRRKHEMSRNRKWAIPEHLPATILWLTVPSFINYSVTTNVVRW
jgi:hypothetical protein